MSETEFGRLVKDLRSPLGAGEAIPNLLLRHEIVDERWSDGSVRVKKIQKFCSECGTNGWLRDGTGFKCWNCEGLK